MTIDSFKNSYGSITHPSLCIVFVHFGDLEIFVEKSIHIYI